MKYYVKFPVDVKRKGKTVQEEQYFEGEVKARENDENGNEKIQIYFASDGVSIWVDVNEIDTSNNGWRVMSEGKFKLFDEAANLVDIVKTIGEDGGGGSVDEHGASRRKSKKKSRKKSKKKSKKQSRKKNKKKIKRKSRSKR